MKWSYKMDHFGFMWALLGTGLTSQVFRLYLLRNRMKFSCWYKYCISEINGYECILYIEFIRVGRICRICITHIYKSNICAWVNVYGTGSAICIWLCLSGALLKPIFPAMRPCEIWTDPKDMSLPLDTKIYRGILF